MFAVVIVANQVFIETIVKLFRSRIEIVVTGLLLIIVRVRYLACNTITANDC